MRPAGDFSLRQRRLRVCLGERRVKIALVGLGFGKIRGSKTDMLVNRTVYKKDIGAVLGPASTASKTKPRQYCIEHGHLLWIEPEPQANGVLYSLSFSATEGKIEGAAVARTGG